MRSWRSVFATILLVVLFAWPFASAQAFFGLMRACCDFGDWGYPYYYGYGYPYYYGHPYYGHAYGHGYAYG